MYLVQHIFSGGFCGFKFSTQANENFFAWLLLKQKNQRFDTTFAVAILLLLSVSFVEQSGTLVYVTSHLFFNGLKALYRFYDRGNGNVMQIHRFVEFLTDLYVTYGFNDL